METNVVTEIFNMDAEYRRNAQAVLNSPVATRNA